MKAIEINITPEILEKYTTDSSAVSGLQNGGAPVSSCTTPYHLVGFPQTAVKLFELFARNAAGVDYRAVRTDTDKFTLITIKGNSENTEVFNIFRKFGIITGTLNVGIAGTPSHPILYTTAKLMRDIAKYSPDVQAALAFTLFSIAKVCAKVIIAEPAIKNTPIAGTVDSSLAVNDALINFSTIKDITVAEVPTENYSILSYVNNKYCSNYTSYAGNMEYGVLSKANDDGSPNYAESVALVAIPYGKVVYPVVVTLSGNVFTTLELSNFESARDSLISAIASRYSLKNVHINKVSLDTLLVNIPEKAVLTDIVDDLDFEEQFNANAPQGLIEWHKNKATKSPISNESRATLTKMLGIKDVCTSTMDKEAMEELYKDDPYAQQLYKQVKPYYETFDLGTLSANIRGFSKGDIYSMMFIGGSGTGKSTSARVLPARCGIPYTSVNFSVNIEESDIIGSMIPNVQKASAEDPEFVWQDGVLTKAVRNGYCIILEEINFARPGVLGKLNSLLDENRQIDLPTGEVLVAHPNFRIIATCNVAYEGTNRFNKALINRFEDCTVFKDVTRAKAIEIIKTRTGYKNMSKMDPILNVYDALKKYSKEQNLNLVISMRQLLTIFSNGKYYADAADAVSRIMVNGAFIEEPEYQEEFEKSVMPAFKLNYKI